MPIGILRFNLDDPHEAEQFELAQKASDYARVIEELFVFIRRESKHSNRKSITYEKLREKIVEIRNQYLE